MEDGAENFNIAEADADPEEKELNKEVNADFNAKTTSISSQPIGDSNGSQGIDSELDEEGDSQGFHLSVSTEKMNTEEIAAIVLGTVQPEDEGCDAEEEEGINNESSVEDVDDIHCALHKTVVAQDDFAPIPENVEPAELTADNTHSLMCLSDIASTLRPNSLPSDDGFDAEKMDVDFNGSDQDGESHGDGSESMVEPASALDPVSLNEARTEVMDVLHEEKLSEVDNSESFSESRPVKVVEKESDMRIVKDAERTMCKDVFRVDDSDHPIVSLRWNEDLSLGEKPCPNGESVSSDSMLDSNRHDFNLSGPSSSPVNRLSELEKESLKNSISKQICDSEQACVYDNEGTAADNGMSMDESEIENLCSEPDNVETSFKNVPQDDCNQCESPSRVCDKSAQDNTVSTQVLVDNKSTSPNASENQCNGDISFHDDSNQDGMRVTSVEWCDSINISGQTEDNPEEQENCSENLDGKRKLAFDDVEGGENSLSGDVEIRSTKMLKVNHNVAQLNQQTTGDGGSTVRPPCVSRPLDGRVLFPGNIQANSQITEYAQYLGLQPTVKFKCVRCGEKSFSSMMDLKTHQYACLKSHTPSQPNPSPAPFTPVQTSSTNFRITRKVYLCSVCGTYYENWNLFLHMREVHKRHICLFCLGMFSKAEKLAAHLVAKHNISEGHYGNAEEFRLSCNGSVFLMCCSCEKVFSEEDSFSNHPCKDRSLASKSKPLNSSLVSGKSQTSNLSNKPSTALFPEKSKSTSKQSVEAGGLGRPVKPSETKTGKGSSTVSGRPKQILKVKIPMQPKKLDSTPTTKAPKSTATSLSHSSHQPSTGTIYQNNVMDTNQPRITDTHLDSVSDGLQTSSELSGGQLSQQATDGNFMSNLDRTINSVALGISSEALEWQQRKNEEFEELQGLEEPAPLPCLDGAAKSDSDSEGHSIPNYEGEGNVDDVPSIDSSSEQVPEIPDEQPEKQPSPIHIPEMGTPRSEHESLQQPVPVLEEVPNEQPETEPQPADLPPSSPLPPHEPVLDSIPSPVLAEPAEPAPTARTPAEEESDSDSDDSDKLSLVVDETASGTENEEKPVQDEISEPQENVPSEPTNVPEAVDDLPSDEPVEKEPNLVEANFEKAVDIPLADEDVLITEVTFEEPLEDIPIRTLLKECVKTLCYVCVYCSHARRIAVNGKQLALHTLAEHRFAPIDGSDSQDPPPTARFTSRLKDSVQVLQDMFFNTDTYDSTDKTSCLPYDRTYECFHCHFFTRSHKELYIHNRKMHQKTILLCIMCKSNFYSYSELLCHLCPGIYIPQCNIRFHCCMCDVDNLPSAFRLMVHLRKRHHACDVCLEITDDQQKLSSHVWKHKLHHLCYRCGIAYRNKPDITNHLFWKHGTESVLCKKCLQKKWPHVYHFCVPPATFTCEECNSLFTRAVSLRVHKRIHTGEQPHPCTECEERFISKKLLAKHSVIHRTPVPEENPLEVEPLVEKAEERSSENLRDSQDATGSTCDDAQKEDTKEEASDQERDSKDADKRHSSKKKKHKEKEEQKKKVVDVYDLPPLNLSSESDSSDDEAKKDQPTPAPTFTETMPPVPEPIEEPQPAQVVDGIWDNFQNYKANLEKMENAEAAAKNPTPEPQEDPNEAAFKVVMMDHDYCAPVDPNRPTEPVPEAEVKEKEEEPEKNNLPATETDKLENPENITVLENPSLTPTHSKDDTKSIMSESPKKKRSPKKKMKRRSSSSSSNSSSGSDSSSCSCGTNCSCSSSSSSDSSSSSSDSDSSSSEGRRRALVRRQLRKERALEKKKEEEAAAAAVAVPPAAPVVALAVAPAVEEPHIDVMEAEPAFRESDLDTTETETDEDFYDERPQKLLDESQVEKRNLMLLASVAPLNNGSVSSPQVPVPELNPAAVTVGKKRTKKRKKKQASHFHTKFLLSQPHQEMPPPSLSVLDSQQSNVPPTYYSPSPIPPVVQRHPMTPSFQQSTPELNSKRPLVTKLTREVLPNPGSGSETEGRTKRKRMPNKFYGYSSDEDADDSSTQKWRKTETTVAHTPPPPVVATIPRIPVSPLTLKRTVPSVPSVSEPQPPITLQLSRSLITKTDSITLQLSRSLITKTDSDSEDSKRVTSSSSSSDSDDDAMQISEPPTTTLGGDAPVRETNDNLYCYCQCPYDEVSEMIACDGVNCAIEWFHFECVGIMVPPKGQWYCPDCRKNMTGYQGVE